MREFRHLPSPVLDALPLGAHRLVALTDQALFEACGVRIMFTGRAGGVSGGCYAELNTASHVGDDLRDVLRNRQLVWEAAVDGRIPGEARLIVPNQVHEVDFVLVDDSARQEMDRAQEAASRGADGVIVGVAGVGALLNFADCLPFIVVSPSGRFAVAHAGWRGTVGGIAGKAVRELVLADDADPSSYNAYLGPHIRQECFEVGEDVEQRFRDAFGEGAIASPRHVSLAAAVSLDLQSAGMRADRIADSGICTKCNPDQYFSYRASAGSCGRHAAFAVRIP